MHAPCGDPADRGPPWDGRRGHVSGTVPAGPDAGEPRSTAWRAISAGFSGVRILCPRHSTALDGPGRSPAPATGRQHLPCRSEPCQLVLPGEDDVEGGVEAAAGPGSDAHWRPSSSAASSRRRRRRAGLRRREHALDDAAIEAGEVEEAGEADEGRLDACMHVDAEHVRFLDARLPPCDGALRRLPVVSLRARATGPRGADRSRRTAPASRSPRRGGSEACSTDAARRARTPPGSSRRGR